MKTVKAIAGTVVLAALFAAPVQAGTPFTLANDPTGRQRTPNIAVDSHGTAHVVWNVINPDPSKDDWVQYCQLARNAKKCGIISPFKSEEHDAVGPRVLVQGDRVVVLTTRCCWTASRAGGSIVKLLMFDSYDRGHNFYSIHRAEDGEGTQIGTNEISGDAALGPGPFSVTTVSNESFGNRLQVSPAPDVRNDANAAELVECFIKIDPSKKPCALEDRANLGAGAPGKVEAWNSGSIAFVDKLTPIIAIGGREPETIPPTKDIVEGRIFIRRFTGGTKYNDELSWGPFIDAGFGGDEPRLAGLQDDKKGIFLLYRKRLSFETWQYQVRRWNDKSAQFGPAKPVTEVGFPVFADVAMDAKGRLHVAWLATNHSLRYRASKPDGTWGPIVTLATRDQSPTGYTDISVSAAQDGGGFVVWRTLDGKIQAVAFGPTGPVGSDDAAETGECVDSVTVGVAVVLAKEGCLKRVGDKYTAAGDVRVNGVDLDATANSVVVDKGARTLTTSGAVTARVGNIVLGKEKLAWRLPASAGQITDLVGNPATFDTGAFGTSFLGLDVSGYTTIALPSPGQARIPVNLALPAPFGALLGGTASGSVSLKTSNDDGVDLDGLTVHIANVWIGIAEVETFDIKLVGSSPFLLFGSTSLLLPVVQSKLGVEFQLRDGDFDYGKASLEFTNPAQLAVATDVLLKKIVFEVQKGSACGTPTKIGGGVTLAVGPTFAGFALIQVDGSVSYSFPQSSCNLPGVLDVEGDGSFISIPIVHAETRFTTDWQLTFKVHAGIDLSVAKVDVGIEGGIDLDAGQFYAAGHGNLDAFGIGIIEVESIVSNVGMAACGQLAPLVVFGFHIHWGESLGADNFDGPPSCDVDLDEYKPAGFLSFASAPASLVARSATFTLPSGLPFAEVRLDGVAAAPGFVLTGPNGLRIEHAGEGAPLAQGPEFAVYASPSENKTYVRLDQPTGGQYIVAGSATTPIANALVANGLPEPRVVGKVARVGSKYELRYTVRQIPGQVVRFVEEAAGVHDVIAATKQAKGKLRFTPVDGRSGKRTVYAIVESGGVPRARIRVAGFDYRATRLNRPPAVRVVRKRSSIVVSWRRTAGAVRYAVQYRLRDGRRGAELERATRYVIRNVPAIDAGTIEVAAVRRDNRVGPAVRVVLKANPKKARHHR